MPGGGPEPRRAKGGKSVQPSRAGASAPREPTRPQPVSQQVANSQITTGAPSFTSDRVTRAQLADKLQEITTIALRGLENEQDVWVASRFAGDGAALLAAAKKGDNTAHNAVCSILSSVRRLTSDDIRAAAARGDIKVKLATALVRLTCADERNEWMKQELTRNIDECIYSGCLAVDHYFSMDDGKPERARIKDEAISLLRVPADCGSKTGAARPGYALVLLSLRCRY